MNRNIAKQFTTTLSLLDVASDRTHKYKCFHGEDIQLTVNVVGENNRLIDLSNTSVKIYFILDKNVNEPVYRQDTGIVVNNLGVITVMLEKSYIRIGNNTLKIVLYDEDQTVFLQPLIISCIDPSIGEEADLEIPDDINVRDEIYDIRRIIGDLQDFDDDLGSEIVQARKGYGSVGERLDAITTNFDNFVNPIEEFNLLNTYPVSFFGVKADGITDDTEALRKALTFRSDITLAFPENETIIITEPIRTDVNNLKIIGNNCTIKVKDNCNILNRHSNREFFTLPDANQSHLLGILTLVGDNIKIQDLNVDVNCMNNAYTDANGGVWYQFSTNHGDSTIPSGEKASGFCGIYTCGNNATIDNCSVANGSWGGIIATSLRKPIKATGVEIKNCTVKNCMQDAISFTFLDGAHIHHNLVEDTQYHAIHSYNANFNILIDYNTVRYTKQYQKIKVTPTGTGPNIVVPINISHSNYIYIENKNIVFDNNEIINESSAYGSWAIVVQHLSYTRNYRISNNYIYNFGTGVTADIYNFGENFITNNRFNNCINTVLIRQTVTANLNNDLPTFTTEIPNETLIIKGNSFYKCTNGVKGEILQAGNTLHAERTSGVKIFVEGNYGIDKVTHTVPFDTENFEKLTVDYGYRLKDLALHSLSTWTYSTSTYASNYFVEDRKTNTVSIFFDLEKGTNSILFYVPYLPSTGAFTFNATIFKSSGGCMPVLINVDSNKIAYVSGASNDGTERLVGNITYFMN